MNPRPCRVCLTVLGVFFAFVAFPNHLASQPAREITTVRQIRALPQEQARQAHPLRLRGIVTVLSGWKSSFFLQDPTAGISIDRASDSPVLHPGDLVEVRGVTSPGLFAPVVVAEKIRVLGQGRMPEAPLEDIGRLGGGKLDSQWISIQGVVRSAGVQKSWGRSVLLLTVDLAAGNLITVRVHDFAGANLDILPASTVAIRGVCGTVFNDRRQFIGLRLFVATMADVKVQRLAPLDPFDSPLHPLDSLLQFSGDQSAVSRIKVQGTVTYAQAGHGFYVQDEGHGVFVQPLRARPIAVGSRVEVAGYPAIGRYSPELDDAVVRVKSAGQLIAGLAESAASMIVEKDHFKAAPYDSLLVQLQGRLVESVLSANENLLLLRDGASVFSVRLPRAPADDWENNFVPGSLLRVTGICAAKADESHEASSFEILLRSASDVVVLEAGPWWTASHAQWVVFVLSVLVFGMSGWLVLVRRQNRLRSLTVTDPLTGLYNRRGFLLLAQQQWQSSLRKGKPFLLFYLDVDHFKEINDSLGHQQGDSALQTVSSLLRSSFRRTDIIGRMGGDEFAIAGVGTTETDLGLLEERLAETVKSSNGNGQAFRLALSVGALIGDRSMEHFSIEDLVARADTLMYEQKRGKRGAGKTDSPVLLTQRLGSLGS